MGWLHCGVPERLRIRVSLFLSTSCRLGAMQMLQSLHGQFTDKDGRLYSVQLSHRFHNAHLGAVQRQVHALGTNVDGICIHGVFFLSLKKHGVGNQSGSEGNSRPAHGMDGLVGQSQIQAAVDEVHEDAHVTFAGLAAHQVSAIEAVEFGDQFGGCPRPLRCRHQMQGLRMPSAVGGVMRSCSLLFVLELRPDQLPVIGAKVLARHEPAGCSLKGCRERWRRTAKAGSDVLQVPIGHPACCSQHRLLAVANFTEISFEVHPHITSNDVQLVNIV